MLNRKISSARVLGLCFPILLAACVSKTPQDASGSYFKLTNIGRNGDVCNVLTDGSGTPIKVRGSMFAKPDAGCKAAQAYTSGKIAPTNIMKITANSAEAGWTNSGYLKFSVTKYGIRRHTWVATAKK